MRAIPFAILIFSFFSAAHAGEPGTPGPLIGFLAGQIMAEVDLDGDHRVSRGEFRTVRQQYFSKADDNRDRLVTPHEFRAELAGIAGGIGLPWAQQLFDGIDGDGDGLLAPDEVEAAGEAFFAHADRNGDGFVTVQEAYPALARSD